MGKDPPVDPYILEELLFDLTAVSPATRLQAFQRLLEQAESKTVCRELRKFCFRESDPEVRHFAFRHLDCLHLPADEDIPLPRALAAEDAGAPAAEAEPDKASRLFLTIFKAQLKLIQDPLDMIQVLRKAWVQADDRILEVLVECLKLDDDPVFLSFAISLLGRAKNPTFVAKLRPFLEHKDSRVRANTIETLSRTPPDDFATILEPFLQDTDNRVRANAVLALMSVQKPAAWAALRRMAESTWESYRDSALYCLSQLSGPEVGDLVRQMFQRESVDYQIYKQATLFLSIVNESDRPMLTQLAADPQSGPDKRAMAKRLLARLQELAAAGCPEVVSPATTGAESSASGNQARTGSSREADQVLGGAGDAASPARRSTCLPGAVAYHPESDATAGSAVMPPPGSPRPPAVPSSPSAGVSSGGRTAVRVRQSLSRPQKEVELTPETWMERVIVGCLAFYQHRPRLMVGMVLGGFVIGLGLFLVAIKPRPASPVRAQSRLAFETPAARVRASAPKSKRQAMLIKGTVRHLGENFAHVDTGRAAYRLYFREGLPEGCQLEARVEARGLYTGYDYASRAISLNCQVFSPLSPAAGGRPARRTTRK